MHIEFDALDAVKIVDLLINTEHSPHRHNTTVLMDTLMQMWLEDRYQIGLTEFDDIIKRMFPEKYI